MTTTPAKQEKPCTGIATCKSCQAYRAKKFPKTETIIQAGALLYVQTDYRSISLV